MSKRLLAVLIPSLLTACASIENPGKKIAAIPPADIRSNQVGDTYVYSDDFTEEVISIEPHQVTWALGPTSIVAVRSTNFFDPTLKWQLDGITYKFEPSSKSGSLWPLHEMASETLVGQLVVEHKNGVQSFDQQWTCKVTHSEHLQLKTGEYDTFVVDCHRQSDTGAHWQRRRFNYAPSLGHPVRIIEEMRAHGYPGYVFKQRDLVYFRHGLPSDFTTSFQTALSTHHSGQVFSYERDDMRYRAELVSTSMSDSGLLCRELNVHDEHALDYSAWYCLTAGKWTLKELKAPFTGTKR